MSRKMMRRTMGQDWGGRESTNPPNAPRVTRQQVENAAQEAGISVRREGPGWSMWMWQKPGEPWRVLGDTNFRALSMIRWLRERGEI